MKTLDVEQQTLADSLYKTVNWYFECSNTYIDYDAQTGRFTVGNTVYQRVDGSITAYATIERIERFTQTAGRLHISGVWGTFIDDEVIYEVTYGDELLTDGGLEAWTGDTLDSWTETEVGTSEVVDENSIKQAGSHSAKCTVDASGSAVGIQQAESYTANSFYIADLYLYGDGSNVIVIADDTGLVGGLYETETPTAAWNNYTYVFQANAASDTLYIGRNTSDEVSWSFYVDALSLKKITNAAVQDGSQQGDIYHWSFIESSGHDSLYFDADELSFGIDEVVFGAEYEFKVIKESFNGIKLSAPLNQYGTYAPNTLSFDITNADDSLSASDFTNSRILLSLAFEVDGTSRVMRNWKYVVDQASEKYYKINFYCKDFIAKSMEGDYPTTPLASDLFSPLSADSTLTDSEPFCSPIPFGTCYIPLKVVSDSAYNKGYLLGPDEYTYTVSEVSSPRYFNAAQTWESTDADFNQDTKSDRFDPSQDWKILYPYLAKMDLNSYSGAHDGGDDQSTLTDSSQSWTADELIGLRVINSTDGSAGYITDNDSTTITATLSGGTGNDWDDDDEYYIESSGLWVVNNEFQNLLVKFSRSDLSSTTDPADVIEYVLEDIGIGSGNIDSATTFASASTTYASWSLSFNGAYYYKQPRAKAIASLLNQCHSTLDIDSKIELRTLSKTSQKTLDNSDILKGSFNNSFLTRSEYDSGSISFQESGKPQDIFQKLTVPAKNTWDHTSSEVLEVNFIQDDQVAQAIGMLYYQRKYLRESRETFNTKSNCVALQPNDVITINHANYGPSHNVLIEEMQINKDASLSFTCIRFSLSLDDFDDLLPANVSITTDENDNYWQPVIAGPDGVTPGTGSLPHLVPGRLRIGASGDYILIDPTAKSIESSNYVSGVTGSGFYLDPDLLEVGNVAIRGIIRAAVFQKDVISAIGGNLLIRPADILASDMSALDASNLTIEGNETFSVGDILRIKDGVNDEWMTVSGIGSAPTYSVTRDVDAQYGADSNPAWPKGVTAVNYGQSGDGGIILSSSATNAPYIDVFTHAGAPYDTLTTRLRIGNLNGFLGNVTDLYGIAVGESGKSLQYDPTNGLVLTGPGIEVGTSGYFRSAGKTSYSDTDAGIWIGYDSGDYKVNIGDGTSYITWDGSTLTVTGGVSAESVEVGTSGYVRTTGKTSYSDTDAGFWLGYDSGAYKLNIGNSSDYMKWTGTELQVSAIFMGAAAGNIVEASHVEEQTFNAGSGAGWIKKSEFTIGRGGTYRVTWEHQINFGGGYTMSTRVYRNGAGVGTTKTATTVGVYESESDDVSGWSPGDLLQIYCTTNYGPGLECKLKNIRVKSDSPMMTTHAEEDV